MSSTQTPHPTSSSPPYIHEFGYHLAKKLLGVNNETPSIFHNCITTKQPPSYSNTSSLSFYRAHWRSDTMQFPWNLSSHSSDDNEDEAIASTVRLIRAEPLFVDVTFDFVDVHHSSDASNSDTGSTTTISKADDDIKATFTAVRIGALVALPDDDRHYYLRGDPLTANDVYRHCRRIDIDPENTHVETVAEMFARSFRSLSSSSLWRVVGKSLDSNDLYVWELEICHSGELRGEAATLPLCSGTRVECLGEPIQRRLLDMIFLQRNNDGGHCVRISNEEGRSFWGDMMNGWDCKSVTQSSSCGVEEDHGVPTEEDSTTSFSVANTRMDSTARQNNARQSQPPQFIGNGKADIKRPERISSGSNHGNRISRVDPRRQETVMYAQGKKTCIAGSKKKKKAKFTLGSI